MQILRIGSNALPVIFYTYYTPASSSIPAIAAQEHALGRWLLREGLSREFQIRYSPEVLEESLVYGLHGKPKLRDYPDVHFNITHCSGLAACAFSDAKIGIDSENPGYFADILIKRALSAPEKEILQKMGTTPSLRQEWFYRFWTLKEAYVKKSGVGVDTDLTAFSFAFPEKPADGTKFLREETLPLTMEESAPGKERRKTQEVAAIPEEAGLVGNHGTNQMDGASPEEAGLAGDHGTKQRDAALPEKAAPVKDPGIAQRDTALPNERQSDIHVDCSDPTVRCIQTRLGHGQILSVCW